jgi:hypothetical protein
LCLSETDFLRLKVCKQRDNNLLQINFFPRATFSFQCRVLLLKSISLLHFCFGSFVSPDKSEACHSNHWYEDFTAFHQSNTCILYFILRWSTNSCVSYCVFDVLCRLSATNSPNIRYKTRKWSMLTRISVQEEKII